MKRHEHVRQLVYEIFYGIGFSEVNAEKVTDRLLENDASGYASHGIRRLFQYVEDVHQNRLQCQTTPEVTITNDGIIHMDAHFSLGVLVMETLIQQLQEHALHRPMTIACVKNAHHLGRLAPLGAALSKSPHDLLTLGFCNYLGGGARVALPDDDGGARLCTNPLLFSFPVKNKPPFVLDMSTSLISEGTIAQAAEENFFLDDAFLMGKTGNPVYDPQALYTTPPTATMAPLGYPTASYKGYGMAVFIEAMVGMLSEAHHVANPLGGGNGFLVIVLNPRFFCGQNRESPVALMGAEILRCCYQKNQSKDENYRYPGSELLNKKNVGISERLYKKIIDLHCRVKRGNEHAE